MPPQMTAGMNAPPAAAPAPQLARLSMTLIRPDGSEGATHDLRPGDNKVGRNFGPVFQTDFYLSPVHAQILIHPGGTATIRDLDSANGIFVRMTQEEELVPGQVFRVGQEMLRFEAVTPYEPDGSGTELSVSPNPGWWAKLVVLLGDGITGGAFPLLATTVTLGRSRGDINFIDDGYVSGLHARLEVRDGRVFLIDLGSSNGTFIKINGERAVGHGTLVLLGEQLFRLNLLA